MTLEDEDREEIKEELYRIGLEIESEAKRRCPVDTGRLRNSITTKVKDDGTVVVGTNVEYAPYIEYGTDPHVITPSQAEVLNFTVDGEEIFTEKVEHPGTVAQPFLRPAVDQVVSNRFEGGITTRFR